MNQVDQHTRKSLRSKDGLVFYSAHNPKLVSSNLAYATKDLLNPDLPLFVRLEVSSVVCSEVSIYPLVDTYRCAHNRQHPYLLSIRPDGHEMTLTTFRKHATIQIWWFRGTDPPGFHYNPSLSVTKHQLNIDSVSMRRRAAKTIRESQKILSTESEIKGFDGRRQNLIEDQAMLMFGLASS